MANTASNRGYRLTAIDVLRGLVIVIMAIDHVRDYFLAGAEQDPMANPNITAGLFATRWITHFCAPLFVLLLAFLSPARAGFRRRERLAASSRRCSRASSSGACPRHPSE